MTDFDRHYYEHKNGKITTTTATAAATSSSSAAGGVAITNTTSLSRANSSKEARHSRGRDTIKINRENKTPKKEVYFLSPSKRRRKDIFSSTAAATPKRDSSSLKQSTLPHNFTTRTSTLGITRNVTEEHKKFNTILRGNKSMLNINSVNHHTINTVIPINNLAIAAATTTTTATIKTQAPTAAASSSPSSGGSVGTARAATTPTITPTPKFSNIDNRGRTQYVPQTGNDEKSIDDSPLFGDNISDQITTTGSGLQNIDQVIYYSDSNCSGTLYNYNVKPYNSNSNNNNINNNINNNNNNINNNTSQLNDHHNINHPVNNLHGVNSGCMKATNSEVSYPTGSLRRSKGRSNQSLCSCDAADTELIPDPTRPLYQYSLDRKNQHTYTCEQNAQILMRLERERQRKLGSSGKLTTSKENKVDSTTTTEETTFEYPAIYPEAPYVENETFTEADIIPPPPPPLRRNPSFTRHYSFQQNQPQQQQQQQQHHHQSSSCTMPTTKMNDCTATLFNCATATTATTTLSASLNYGSDMKMNNHNNSGGGGFYKTSNNKPDICNFTNDPIGKEEKIPLDKLSTDHMFSTIPNDGYKQQQYYQYFIDDNFHKCANTNEDGSLFFYHHEPPQYMPNFETISFPSGKFNTIGPSSGSYHKTKPSLDRNHSSSCNLNQYNSGNLGNGRYFSNSLSNFNFLNNSGHPSYTQFLNGGGIMGSAIIGGNVGVGGGIGINGGTGGGAGGGGGDSYTSTLSSGTPSKQQQTAAGMPWRHRQCSSRGSSSSGTSSTRWDVPSRHWLAVTSILLIAGAAGVAVPLALRVAAGAPLEERLQAATQLLDAVPLIDGHNDLPWNIRKFLHNQLNDFHFDEDLRNVMPWAKSTWSHTDLSRLRKGRVSAQFWAAYVPCEAQHRDAVQLTLEQIDVIKRLTDRYSPELTTCMSVADILEAHKNHQLCSLTGVEGGHSLGGSLGVLRTLYAIGVRYMTLTSTCHTPWADSSHADAPKFDVKHGGLTAFGKTIIREMNRLGMIVDLSHVSVGTMRDALAVSDAPVIFSHSSAYELCNSSRNVQDDILELVAKNRGLVMVNFYSRFLSCSENATVHDAVAHINHIKKVAGIDHVGLGAGFDGINYTPKGLEDVSTYPMLFAELMGDGWTLEDLTKLAGQNFLRVMSDVEKVRDAQKLGGVRPYEEISNRAEDPYNCTSS